MTIENGNQRQCVQKCPPNTYTLENSRCVTEEECHLKKSPSLSITLFPERPLLERPYIAREDGECAYVCPSNYYPDGPSGKRRCIKCGENGCKRECTAGLIDDIATAKGYRGCTHIGGPIVIRIGNEDGRK